MDTRPALRVAAPERRLFLSTIPAGTADRRLALVFVAVSAMVFFSLAPFAKTPLTPVPAFIPLYQSALIMGDLLTAVLLFNQYRILRLRALLALGSAYLFSTLITVAHTLTFPGLFAAGGLLGATPQSTAWIYMFWHGGFPLLVIAYVGLRRDEIATRQAPERAIGLASLAVAAGVVGFVTLATAGSALLPAIMQGNKTNSTLSIVVSAVWCLSLLALGALWRRRPHSVLDLWLIVVMCAWIFDIGLSAVLNAGRFDLGFYAGRIYGFIAATFVLIVLLLENGRLYTQLARAHEGAQSALARSAERLRILHEIDQAMIAEKPTEAIAAAVIQPLRELLGVSRAIVNRFDLEAGLVEWIAAAGRRRLHVGPGVRYSIALMGDPDALRRGAVQRVDVRALPPSREVEALLASGVLVYMVVPMIAGGELLGALSFGSESDDFPEEQISIAREVAAQLAIAMMQARLLARVKEHAADLEARVLERTAELEAVNKELGSFSYSVSHDLRAPLRAVDGYARMLEEDYAARLDEEGRRLLGVIRGSAGRMGQLIDDLLSFSRLGRQPLARQTVDSAALVREVVEELRGASPASVQILKLEPVQGDRALLKQVWINLVGNAFKYSGKRDAPLVEIGSQVEGEENIYWVRDNGAGFDMRYAAKLFGVFQRLHSNEEFSGTGVGLAIVQRVVTRHGGRVWAEGKPGEGACFFFSLPRNR
ncbi:MAG TPA: MASE4 domain-containing protein [Burkholderiales bacterium]|nr:MASE4 domain-containing protein [Burkholderiales bacterium]